MTRPLNGGGAVGALLFVLLGFPFVKYAGIQTDEALFAAPLFRAWSFFSVRLFDHDVPLMAMSYLGTLKTWVYAPIFLLWSPTAAVIRVPVVLAGAATVLMSGALLERMHGRRASWIGSLLLATDTSFLLTTVHDWGPVALQHLLLVASMLLSLRWFQSSGSGWLAGAALCWGLAFWDKAVFIWMFTGLAAGSLLFVHDIRRRLRTRSAVMALGALTLGALPLIVYNLTGVEKFATVRENVNRDSTVSRVWLAYKFRVFESTLDGSALFGYLVNRDAGPRPGVPRSTLERASFAVHALAGERGRNATIIALSAALILFGVLRRTCAVRAMAFLAIAAVVAWVHMALSAGGGAAHHAVLLWPLPQLFLAVAFAETSFHVRFGRWAVALMVVVLAAANVLLTNQYLYDFIRNGGAESWTDAIYPLADDLKRVQPSQVVLPDWGLTDSLCVLNQGRPPTHPLQDPFLGADEPAEQKGADLSLLSDARAIWIDHTSGHEFVRGVQERVLDGARRAGFEAVMLKTYCDGNGRPMFEAFRFRPGRGPETGVARFGANSRHN